MPRVKCKIYKCEYNEDGCCKQDKITISKLGCIDVKTY